MTTICPKILIGATHEPGSNNTSHLIGKSKKSRIIQPVSDSSAVTRQH